MTAQPQQNRRLTSELASGRFGEIVIVQALDVQHEVATGEILRGYIDNLLSENPIGLRQRLVKIEYAAQFVEFVADLARDAAGGRIPLLHVECHGDEESGLHFPNGSELSWESLGRALEPLNRATRFNLVAVFSACHGAHSVGQLEAIGPAPFWFMVAPTSKADAAEIMRGMRLFYRTLIETCDLGSASNALMACGLAEGKWFPVAAQAWFVRIVEGYFEEHCTEEAVTKRAFRLRQEGLLNGKDVGIGRLRRLIRKLHATSPTGKYFDAFFMVENFPENATRFEGVKVDIESIAQALRRDGRHVL